MDNLAELHGHLPRLAREHYQGFAAVHWSMAIQNRDQGWLSPLFHARYREILLHTCVRYDLFCPMYCLMPDHLHLLFRGVSRGADQILATMFLRRYVNEILAPYQFQKQPHDHVLRPADLECDAFRSVAFYIAENPVRAELVSDAAEYAFTGAMLPGVPDVNVYAVTYWDVFWKLHGEMLRQNGFEG